MYRLVIADDDEIQLKGMCCAFPWEELGIEVAAGVEDGDQALEAAIEKQADIPVSYTHLDVYKRQPFDSLCVSNEIEGDEVIISFPYGTVVLMETRD